MLIVGLFCLKCTCLFLQSPLTNSPKDQHSQVSEALCGWQKCLTTTVPRHYPERYVRKMAVSQPHIPLPRNQEIASPKPHSVGKVWSCRRMKVFYKRLEVLDGSSFTKGVPMHEERYLTHPGTELTFASASFHYGH